MSILDEALTNLADTLVRKPPPPVERPQSSSTTIDWSNSDRK